MQEMMLTIICSFPECFYGSHISEGLQNMGLVGKLLKTCLVELTLFSIYTHFNTMKGTTFGKHYGKR